MSLLNVNVNVKVNLYLIVHSNSMIETHKSEEHVHNLPFFQSNP
jgi:hypothetical protein